jgi:hypothetical protein
MYSCGNSSTQVTSSFRSSVPLGGHVRRSNTPGVGEYDPTPVLRKSPSKEGSSSMFAGAQNSRSVSSSSSTREHVGPGSYDLDHDSITKKMAVGANPRSPAFGSASVRAGPARRSTSPAPGAYDAAQSETLSARSTRSFNTTAAMGKASFGTFTKIGSSKTAEGGEPGSYTVETQGVHTGKAESLASRSKRSFNRDINRGKGSFTSASARSSSPAARSARGGPGENDYSHMYSCGNSSTQVTSSFRSSVPLGGHVRRSNTPGVGEYDPLQVGEQSKSFTKDGSPMFADSGKNSRSVSAFSTTGEHVGPGSYELEQGSIYQKMLKTNNDRLPGFLSSSVRKGPE